MDDDDDEKNNVKRFIILMSVYNILGPIWYNCATETYTKRRLEKKEEEKTRAIIYQQNEK